MTLEGAIKFHEIDSYIIYTMNSATTGQYCVVLPKGTSGVMNMLVDLHMKSVFDDVSTGTKTKEQLVEKVGNEYLKLKVKYANEILVCPMIDEAMLQSAIVNNDKQKMFDEVKKIGAITSEIYKKLTESGVEKQNIDQKIIIVEKNDNDGKFVVWLKEQMPNFVDGIRYSELEPKQEAVNPFMESVSNVSTPVTPEVVTPVVGGSIFDNVQSSTPVTPTQTVSPVTSEPVIPVTPVVDSGVDIFGIPNNVNGVTPVSEPVVPNPTVTPEVVSVPNNTVSESPAVSVDNAPVVDTPQPVNSVGLEGTTTFSPIPDKVNSVNEVGVNQEVVEEKKKGNQGFVNLIILVVVLIGVTLASVELGKYLYSVYGA